MNELRANSYYNGISFAKSKQLTRAIVQKDGTYRLINSKSIFLTLQEKILIWYYVITSIYFITYSIFHMKNIEFIIGSFIFCAFFYIHIISIFSGIHQCIFKPEFRKYHAAEHKIINYLKKNNNKIPTLEEVKKESRFCDTCQSSQVFYKAILGIVWIILLYAKISLLYKILIFIGIYISIYILYCLNVFVFIQIFLTSKKCSDNHLKIGLLALQELEKTIAKKEAD